MYEIGHFEGRDIFALLETGQYTYLAGEINALYHEAAVKTGISDSVQIFCMYFVRKMGNVCKAK